MNIEINIENQTSREMNVIYIPVTLPKDQIHGLARFFMKLGIHTFQNGGKATGVSFVRHLAERENEVDLEVCIELEEPILELDEIKTKLIPAWEGKFVVAKYKGSRLELPKVYERMIEFLKSEQIALAEGIKYDFYLNTAHQVPESELLTKVFWPVKEV